VLDIMLGTVAIFNIIFTIMYVSNFWGPGGSLGQM